MINLSDIHILMFIKVSTPINTDPEKDMNQLHDTIKQLKKVKKD
jgi:hypothetical protein